MKTLQFSAVICMLVLFGGFAISQVYAADYEESKICRDWLKYGSKYFEECIEQNKKKK